jgi:hypothetical protein
MDTPHLSFEISFSALDPFLDHWASRYSDSERDERLYDPYIRKADLRTDLEALKALFTWKNGGDRISERNLGRLWVKTGPPVQRYYVSSRQVRTCFEKAVSGESAGTLAATRQAEATPFGTTVMRGAAMRPERPP